VSQARNQQESDTYKTEPFITITARNYNPAKQDFIKMPGMKRLHTLTYPTEILIFYLWFM
jgi:hypothetical protein